MMSNGMRNGAASSQQSQENTFKILVTSNVHLGFAEREQNRSVDSFVTFSEIIDLAKKTAVDFVLITGNLFHESRPSRWAVHSALDLLRSNCLGGLPIRIECLNDWARPLKDGSASLHMPNFVDPNINVELPVFVVHGFSDDPSGLGNLSELDTLDRAGMLNYYGKMSDNSSVNLQPLLLRKGTSMLALYSLGAIREELLERMIEKKSVSFTRSADSGEQFFNLLAMHQPRKSRIRGRSPFADFVEPWMDLVVNGQSTVGTKDISNEGVNFRFIEPGSTIRTTLNEEDVAPKQVLLLEICGKTCRVESIALKSVRPLILDRFVWKKEKIEGEKTTEEQSNEFHEELKMMVQRVIERAQRERTNNPRLPWPPAVQITIENADNSKVNPTRLGLEFSNVAVNATHMFKMTSRRTVQLNGHRNGNGNGTGDDIEEIVDSKEGILDNVCSIDDAVAVTLREWQARGDFSILTAEVQMEAMKLYVEKEDDVAIQDAYDWEKCAVMDHMIAESKAASIDGTNKEIREHHELRCSTKSDEKFLLHHTQMLCQPKTKGSKKTKASKVWESIPTPVIKQPAARKVARSSTRSSSHDSEVAVLDGEDLVPPPMRITTRRNGARNIISTANGSGRKTADTSMDRGHESEPTSESSVEVPAVVTNGNKRGRGRPPGKKPANRDMEADGAAEVYTLATGRDIASSPRTSRSNPNTELAAPLQKKGGRRSGK